MATNTSIEWTHRPGTISATLNPTTGCDKISAGCDNCYALTMAKRLKGMGQPKYQNDGHPVTSGPGFGLTIHPDVLAEPLRWRSPRTVFVNSMSSALGCTVTTFPAVLTAPDTDVFTDHGGIPVTFVGDEGTMVALGHHNLDAAEKAFTGHDIWSRDAVDILVTWAVLGDPPTHACVSGLTISCFVCEEASGVPWWMQWGVPEGTPGAFPVMVVES